MKYMMKIKRILVLAITAMISQSLVAEKKPNFIIFLVDDLGYNDIGGVFGSKNVKTPNLDAMAENGVAFTSAYVGSPVCGPSRAALMTGSYPMRIAEPNNSKNPHTEPVTEELMIPEVLKEQGYATALIGKWHIGNEGDVAPLGQGFDYFWGTLRPNGQAKTLEKSKVVMLYEGTKSLGKFNQEMMNNITTEYTERSIKFIKENKDNPFFLYLSHNMPHVVLGVSDKFKGKSGKGLFYDVVMELDWSVGEIRKTLKEEGLADNTFLVFLSDNGPWVSDHLKDPEGDHYGNAYPLRGSKMMSWDGGARVPMIMEFPKGLPKNKVIGDMVFSMDIFPTFAKLAGAELPEDLVIDGVDIMPFVTGKEEAAPHEYYYYYCYTMLCAVRDSKWKLVLPREKSPKFMAFWSGKIDAVEGIELYDMENDISETNNVAKDHPEVVERLMKQIELSRKSLGDYNLIGEDVRAVANAPIENRLRYRGKSFVEGDSDKPAGTTEKKSSKKKAKK